MPQKREKVETKGQKTSKDNYIKVQETAYTIYLERIKKNQPGDHNSDWAAAEAKLGAKKKS